jgi:hypothetical protein
MTTLENIVLKEMKKFQVRENIPQKIMVFPTKAIKRLQNNGIILFIKHTFVWSIIYEQFVANVGGCNHNQLNQKPCWTTATIL